ncbi:MAG: sulfatase [Verrucomicrobiota bacterium]|nr:sulfatase [Verrucomicrobiota bacterium]
MKTLLPVLILLNSAFCILCSAAENSKYNVLFVAFDDLRPDLACYGDPVAITPNFDRLASQGTVFNRAYCQLAVCGPSRLSLITGLRPDTIKVWDLKTHFRETLPDLVTLPQYFKNNGYHSQAIGKILHGSSVSMYDPPSWSEDPLYDYGRPHHWRYASPENLAVEAHKRTAVEGEEVPDDTFVDGLVCVAAEEALNRFAESQKPFFLGVGFRKPHLPFVAPKKYWDLYEQDDIPKRSSTAHPKEAPEYAVRTWNEIEGYTDIPKQLDQISEEKIRELRHGYYACISYVDALLGRLLDKLKERNLEDSTIVCLWGDHGFHLGEQGLWTKANNYELSARVPLIIYSPSQKHKGATSNAFVELVDLYPTLAELCGLEIPDGLEGLSMKPLLDNSHLSWKSAAFNQYPRDYTNIKHTKHGDVMGYAVRTDRFRYVEWRDWKSNEVLEQELYDSSIDPHETINRAGIEEMASTVARHQEILSAGWQGALPKN